MRGRGRRVRPRCRSGRSRLRVAQTAVIGVQGQRNGLNTAKLHLRRFVVVLSKMMRHKSGSHAAAPIGIILGTRLEHMPTPLPPACPPPEARFCEGVIYRFVKCLDADSFTTHFEKYPGRDWGIKLCEAHGLSICRTLEAARTLQGRVPGMAKKQIAVAGCLIAGGVTLQTGSEPLHHTWWADFFEPAVFTLVDEEGL